MENIEEKRSATDILLDIERKLDFLEKRQQNSEGLLKITLGRLNKLFPDKKEIAIVEPVSQKTVSLPMESFEDRQKANNSAKLAEINAVVSSFDADQKNLVSEKVTKTNKGNKLQVSQILSANNTALFLANIEVLNTNGELINQTRTNTKGRWLMALTPGDYQVHVIKNFPADSGKKNVDIVYPVNIPLSAKPIELSPLSVDNG
jgi:Ca2+-binding RTX toxin-like protein